MESPELSIVIAATDSLAAIRSCVESIGEDDGVEILVAADPSRIMSGRFQSSRVRWILGEPGCGVHRLRRLGLDASTGRVVVFTEDSCRVGPGWLSVYQKAFTDPRLVAATGPVEHREGASLVDWAVFFCEYAPFLSGKPAKGGARRLAGNNFAVLRSSLASDASDVHESLVAGCAKDREFAMMTTDAMVWHCRHYTLGQAIGDRLRFGHEFGRLQASEVSPWFRGSRIVLGPAILASQLLRLAFTLLQKRRLIVRAIAAAPLTSVLLAAWSGAEWLGWIRGPNARPVPRGCEKAGPPASRSPGRSMRRSGDYRPRRANA